MTTDVKVSSATASSDPFKAHLIALLSSYELGPTSGTPTPRYDGPRDSQSEAILRRLDILVQSLWYPREDVNSAEPQTDAASLSISSDGPQLPINPSDTNTSQSAVGAAEDLSLTKTQVRDVVRVCNAIARGDFSQRITVPVQSDDMVHLKHVINTMVNNFEQLTKEITRMSLEIGTEGIWNAEPIVLDVEGAWLELVSVVNNAAEKLDSQIRSIAKVTKAVAIGDLSKQIEVEARGETLALKNTVNDLVVRLRVLQAEVTRVKSEAASQGKIERHAQVPNMEGVWRDLVRNINEMCSALSERKSSI